MAAPEPFNLERVLEPLKDFQRRSVDYIIDRLYGENSTRRFLLADEVGLGKTMVARGVIARSIKHLRAKGVERVNIIYICSNGDIARQNINRLNVTGDNEFRLATRITLLPLEIIGLEKRPLNFISFTPDTSFNLRSSLGTVKVRWMLFWMLKHIWPDLMEGTGPMNVLQGYVERERFRNMISEGRPSQIDGTILARFKERIEAEDRQAHEQGRSGYQQRFKELCETFRYSRKLIPKDERDERSSFVGGLQALLAATCVQSLEPHLVILDEFQRFKNLLQPDDHAGEIARHLFNCGDTRVLLLSATPYKMYTLSGESQADDHYRDFLDTLRFLLNDPHRSLQLEAQLRRYRHAALKLGSEGADDMRAAKVELQESLRRVMVRTERLAATADRSGMLREVNGSTPRLTREQISSYIEVQKIGALLGQADVVEYWKSSPYLLNFMEDYQLKRAFRAEIAKGASASLVNALTESRYMLFPNGAWRGYGKVDSCNAQMMFLLEQTLNQGWWRLLWMPPALHYYQLSGPFADVDSFRMTKRLVFSSWNVVPRAVSVLLSYEADRRMVTSFEPTAQNTHEDRERRRALLTFARSRDRLTGMPVLGLMYPSIALAGIEEDIGTLASPPTLRSILLRIQDKVRVLLAPLTVGTQSSGQEDERWYWAAPLMLDRLEHPMETAAWFKDAESLAKAWAPSVDDDSESHFHEHLAEAGRVASGEWQPEGRVPDDLIEVVALLTLAGPGVCSLRALARVSNCEDALHQPEVRTGAAQMAWAFRSLFNIPEVTCLLRGMDDREPYWRRVLDYSAQGCLQSVLDEYAHVLLESLGLFGKPTIEVATAISRCAADAIGMRSAVPGMDNIALGAAGVTIENQRTRARFAMRFGQERSDDRREQHFRADHVRNAFNSPFWPFVLATTSIGQEGLDFHSYCHAVVHWNLPSNPVDLEQREGRVHRYKGHAVRKNVARAFSTNARSLPRRSDPWRHLFEQARRESHLGSDLVPYWVFPLENGVFIERHVPALPLSRESNRLPNLRRSLAVYRMVFGQPRQDDLVAYLLEQLGSDELEALSAIMRIDLSPNDLPNLPQTPSTSVLQAHENTLGLE